MATERNNNQEARIYENFIVTDLTVTLGSTGITILVLITLLAICLFVIFVAKQIWRSLLKKKNSTREETTDEQVCSDSTSEEDEDRVPACTDEDLTKRFDDLQPFETDRIDKYTKKT